jgi:hypothetical protein
MFGARKTCPARQGPVGWEKAIDPKQPAPIKTKSDEPAANRDDSRHSSLVPWAARPERIQRASPERHPLS